MKCFVLVALCLAYAEGGAIRCTPGIEDSSCTKEEVEKEKPTQSPLEIQDMLYRRVCTESKGELVENCRRYFCTEAGVVAYRTIENCNQKMIEDQRKCTPNTTFTRDCNTCLCLENGLGLCTVKTCGRSTIPKKSELVSGKECAVGTYWKSQCNDCGCTPDGYAFCTEKACIDQASEPMMRCAPDTMWNNDCNTCWCTTDGRAMCTRMGCASDLPPGESTGNQDPSEPVTKFDNVGGNTEELKAHYSKESMEYPDSVNENSKNTKYESDNSNHEKLEHSFEELDNGYIEPNHSLEDSVHVIEDNDNLLEETHHIRDKHNVLKRSVCKPNQVFQSECNTCKCAPDGQSYTCTQNECMEGEKNKEVEVFMESEGEDHIERHSVCKPRGTFYIGCNTCHCNPYGTDYSCTNKPCPLPEDVELFHELKATKSSKNNTQKIVCVANRMFVKDCNTCWCNEDGTSFICTRKVCVQELPEESTEEEKSEDLRIIKKECRPDEVFELDCNMCRCNPDGKSFSCTRRACVDRVDEDTKNITLIRKARGVTQEAPKACQPGQEFRMDCNKCLCDNEGQDFSCTRIDCNAQNGNNGGARSKRDTSEQVTTECSPGSVFDMDCNVCRCTTDGHHAMCTTKRCSVPNTQDNDVNSPLPESDPNFRCNPGEQFKRGCNDCSCSADGKSVFCTVRFCDQDITPPPSL